MVATGCFDGAALRYASRVRPVLFSSARECKAGRMAKASVELELLVQRIQQQLAPAADVQHNVRIPGRHTGAKRQIDVLVHERVGQYDINIVIDCKDYKHPVDVKGVEEFSGLLDDVGAQKGVLVCPAGFSEIAKARARALQIDLYSPVDTELHKWQATATIPATCEFRLAGMGFTVSTSAPLPFMIRPGFFSDNMVVDEHGNELGTCYRKIVERWNAGDFAELVGTLDDVPIFGDTPVQTDNGYGQLCPVELYAPYPSEEAVVQWPASCSEDFGFQRRNDRTRHHQCLFNRPSRPMGDQRDVDALRT